MFVCVCLTDETSEGCTHWPIYEGWGGGGSEWIYLKSIRRGQFIATSIHRPSIHRKYNIYLVFKSNIFRPVLTM